MESIFDRIFIFRDWLGRGRFNLLLGVFVSTGFLSFALFFVDTEWSIAAQNSLIIAFLLLTAWVIGGRLDSAARRMWLAILAPAFGLVVLGVVFVQSYYAAFLGAAFGWVIVGLLIFGRSQAPIQYRTAIKAMRKGDYQKAIATMDDLIKVEKDEPNHYRFRAELLRLWGKLGRARRDYEQMLNVSKNDAERAVAYNGMAEVELQSGKYEPALESALKAYELSPDEWVAAYNLGMIQDRLSHSDDAVASLSHALTTKVPDARHRLLIYFYLIRAHSRLNQPDAANDALKQLKREKNGLEEWQTILQNEQAAVLREVLSADIDLAAKLVNDELTVMQLAEASN